MKAHNFQFTETRALVKPLPFFLGHQIAALSSTYEEFSDKKSQTHLKGFCTQKCL